MKILITITLTLFCINCFSQTESFRHEIAGCTWVAIQLNQRTDTIFRIPTTFGSPNCKNYIFMIKDVAYITYEQPNKLVILDSAKAIIAMYNAIVQMQAKFYNQKP